MTGLASLTIFALTALASIIVLSAASLKAWHGWIDLKRLQLGKAEDRPVKLAGARIELADLRERVRRLEAIANGTEI
jgi:hypothetical protein